ncbi:hypothetical protein F4604DRAFT_1686117 [Suillus subluteus]|nr:hypothetical protein F4604DRAFT_1686117 [Suillus subluteus]
MRFVIASDSGYRDSFESTGSTGTFGPPPSQPRIVISPSQLEWGGAMQMITSSQIMEVLHRLDAKVDRLESKINQLDAKVDKKQDELDTKLTTHGTKLLNLRNAAEDHNKIISSEIKTLQQEMQGMEKRLIDRIDESTTSQQTGLDELVESQKTIFDKLFALFKQ